MAKRFSGARLLRLRKLSIPSVLAYDPGMRTLLQPWQIIVASMAGWITRQQKAAIDYLREENRVLKQQLGRGTKDLAGPGGIRVAANGSPAVEHPVKVSKKVGLARRSILSSNRDRVGRDCAVSTILRRGPRTSVENREPSTCRRARGPLYAFESPSAPCPPRQSTLAGQVHTLSSPVNINLKVTSAGHRENGEHTGSGPLTLRVIGCRSSFSTTRPSRLCRE